MNAILSVLILFFGLLNPVDASCSLQQFQCENGNCIPESYFCDNSIDCSEDLSDTSDEPLNCCRIGTCCNPSCLEGQYKCPVPFCNCVSSVVECAVTTESQETSTASTPVTGNRTYQPEIKSSDLGLIVGSGVGITVGILIIAGIVYCVWRQKCSKRGKNRKNQVHANQQSYGASSRNLSQPSMPNGEMLSDHDKGASSKRKTLFDLNRSSASNEQILSAQNSPSTSGANEQSTIIQVKPPPRRLPPIGNHNLAYQEINVLPQDTNDTDIFD